MQCTTIVLILDLDYMKNIRRIGLPIVAAFLFQTSAFSQVKTLIELVEIPAGSYYMGSEGKGENFDEAPAHKVNISKAFRMGATEVTNAQYELFRPEHKKLRGKNNVSTEDDDAVVNVSYQDAVDFCRWLSEKEGKCIACRLKLNGSMLVGRVPIPYFIQGMDCLPICVVTKR